MTLLPADAARSDDAPPAGRNHRPDGTADDTSHSGEPGGAPEVSLELSTGERISGTAWSGPLTPADERLLARVDGPVLDIGCGPARHTEALIARGVPALGIDISAAAVGAARERGIPALERCVFDWIPTPWATALLLDGNIGIGGDAIALLTRTAELVEPGGTILVELASTGAVAVTRARLLFGSVAGPWFDWTVVEAPALEPIARAVGLRVEDLWCDDGRQFATLRTAVRHRTRPGSSERESSAVGSTG